MGIKMTLVNKGRYLLPHKMQLSDANSDICQRSYSNSVDGTVLTLYGLTGGWGWRGVEWMKQKKVVGEE
jgi:hypothetical protein